MQGVVGKENTLPKWKGAYQNRKGLSYNPGSVRRNLPFPGKEIGVPKGGTNCFLP